jgi:hypothetical protein
MSPFTFIVNIFPEIGSFQRYSSSFRGQNLRISVSVEVSVFFILLQIFSKNCRGGYSRRPEGAALKINKMRENAFCNSESQF